MLRYVGGGYYYGVPMRDLSAADVAALPDGWTAARLVATGRYAWATGGSGAPSSARPPSPLPGWRWKRP